MQADGSEPMQPPPRVSRRALLAAGGGLAASAVVPQAAAAAAMTQGGSLPVAAMTAALQAEGVVIDGVLVVEVAREDLGAVIGPGGITLTPAFQSHGRLAFQPLRNGYVLLNGYHPVVTSETNSFIDGVRDSGLQVQALTQAYTGLDPQLWLVHMRGYSSALGLAKAIRNAFGATDTPFPQALPRGPHSSLDAGHLARILRGHARIAADGVVRVTVPRRGRVRLSGVELSPQANISTNVEFQPSEAGGSETWAAASFSLSGPEAFAVVKKMRSRAWTVHSLASGHTDEHPQLYFSNMLKSGEAGALAHEIREGLDLTDSR
jgi:Domain of Unknown Function (DUF1259)